MNRERELFDLGLSNGLISLCGGHPPHPIFEYRCGSVYIFNEELAEAEELTDLVALWELSTSVIACRRAREGLEFVRWNAEWGEPPELIARCEQGLLFWLFSYLFEDQDWEQEEVAVQQLREAAQAVGFRYLERVSEFERRFGGETDYAERLVAEARMIAA